MEEEAACQAAQEDAAAQQAVHMAACNLAVMLAPVICIRKWCVPNIVVFMSGQDASSAMAHHTCQRSNAQSAYQRPEIQGQPMNTILRWHDGRKHPLYICMQDGKGQSSKPRRHFWARE